MDRLPNLLLGGFLVSRKLRLSAAFLVVLLTATLFAGVAGANDRRDHLFGRIRTVFEVVEQYHKDGADLDKFFEGAVKGGLEALGDPYTNYFSPPEFQAFQDSLEGTFTGIGIYLEVEGNYVIVAAPVKGSPAAAAGLKTGDRILEADGNSLVGGGTERAQRFIRGEADTPVTLKIERPSENRTFTVTIIRELINIPEVDYRMLEQNVGYVQIISFGSSAGREFYNAVQQLKSQGAQAIVLDLRQNPGGYVSTAIEIASGFVPAGQPIMAEVGKGSKQVRTSTGRLINLPVAVLVDGGSASASEILAGAIQDYKVGPLVGTQTFGKGTVQQLLFLEDRAGIKVTIAEYLTAKERHVHGIGLTPDSLVEPYKPDPALFRPLEFTRVLTVNKVGLDVLDLQKRLHYLGYHPDTDGFFSTKTKEAVIDFAQRHGLSTEPIVEQKFLDAVNAEMAHRAVAEEKTDLQLMRAVRLLTEKQ